MKLVKAAPNGLTDRRGSLFASAAHAVRRELEDYPEARELVTRSEPAIAAKEELIKILAITRPGRSAPVAGPGEELVLEQAVVAVLEELEVQRRGPRSLYLVDDATGLAVAALPDNAIWQPPDFIGEDGVQRKARPIVHPGLSSSIALATAESWRMGKAIMHGRESPGAREAYRHLSEPEKMVDFAIERLAEKGIRASSALEGDGWSEVEFGRERVEGVLQSPNPGFHRLHAFADLLVNKIISLCHQDSEVWIGKVTGKSGGRARWYSVKVCVLDPHH